MRTRRRLLVLGGALVLAGLGGVAAVRLADRHAAARPAPEPAAAAPVPSFPPLPVGIDLQSAAASTSAARRDPAGRRDVASRAASASRAVRPAPMTDLAIGSAVGLEVRGTGLRIRHREFVARLDAVDARSGASDRADARFVVRRGMADPSCVTLESANRPGFFLRHREFVLRLDRAAPGPLFAADVTFCAEPRAGGAGLSLRSVNYPDRYLLRDGSAVRLSPVGRAAATIFTVRTPV